MSQTPNTAIAAIGLDVGKNSFHVVGHNARVARAQILDRRRQEAVAQQRAGDRARQPACARRLGGVGYRSAARSSKRMAGGSGQRRTNLAAPSFA